MFKSKRELRADNRRPRWENEDLRKQKDTLKDEVSVYRQKIECATGHVNINPLIETVEALCTNPEYDKWANHPAATILVRLSCGPPFTHIPMAIRLVRALSSV